MDRLRNLPVNDNRKGFEFSIKAFDNVLFPVQEFIKVKGVFMKYDQVRQLFQQSSKRFIFQGYYR